MKKLLLPICAIVISTLSMAQNDRSKDVKTKYLSIPSLDVSQVDVSTLSSEYAMDQGSFGTERMKDVKTTCVKKGGGLKDVIELSTYYYAVPYSKPDSYIVVKDGSGEIIYAAKTSVKSQGSVNFGYKECNYWVADKMKKDWASNKASFKVSEHAKYETEIFDGGKKLVSENLFLTYIEEEFAVFGAKGKSYDYAAIEGAYEKALAAYKNILGEGPNAADYGSLSECITIWEKELESIDLEDKKARISKSIAKGLHENCARAYAYLYDSKNALQHARSFKKLWGNMTTNRTTSIDLLVKRIEKQRVSIDKNQTLVADLSALNVKAESMTGSGVQAKKLAATEFGRLSGEWGRFRLDEHSDISENQQEDENEAIASGTLNPYQKYVTQGVGGPVLMMTMAPNSLLGIPELKELPSEMGDLEGLTQLIVMNNKLESVSPNIGKLSSLTKLDLTGNSLTTLPPEIGQLTSLKILKLSKNPIESLPAEIGNLENLSSLVIKGTKLTPAQISELQRLLPTKCKIKQ
ncbi:MAG: hypothetical protein ACI837_000672 [Crocinitomicaceae bacterium]|jgi:hypothetical protein